MENLPEDIENIIMDYVNQLEYSDRLRKLNKQLIYENKIKSIKKKIKYYLCCFLLALFVFLCVLNILIITTVILFILYDICNGLKVSFD